MKECFPTLFICLLALVLCCPVAFADEPPIANSVSVADSSASSEEEKTDEVITGVTDALDQYGDGIADGMGEAQTALDPDAIDANGDLHLWGFPNFIVAVWAAAFPPFFTMMIIALCVGYAVYGTLKAARS